MGFRFQVRFALVLILVILGYGAPEAVALGLIPVGAYGLPSGSVSPGSATSHASVFGGGGLIDYRILKLSRSAWGIELEWGVLYMPRGYQSNSVATTFKTLEFPLVLRISPVHGFSFILGAYATHGVGGVQQGAGSIDYSKAFLERDDAGFMGGFGFKIPIVPATHLVLDLRYLYGLKNISSQAGTSVSLRDIQVLGGIRFGN